MWIHLTHHAGSGLVVLFVIATLVMWQLYKRRRKYYAAREAAEEEMEMGHMKFTFREIAYQDLRLGKLLGEGAFGKVYKGEYRYRPYTRPFRAFW